MVHFNCLKPYKDSTTSLTVSPPQELLDGQPHLLPPTCTGAGGREQAHKSVFVPIPSESVQDVPEDEDNSTGDVSEEERIPLEKRCLDEDRSGSPDYGKQFIPLYTTIECIRT